MQNTAIAPTDPTPPGTLTFGAVGMEIPSPPPSPRREDRPMGGSAATGSDPRVPADIVVESGDVDGGADASPNTKKSSNNQKTNPQLMLKNMATMIFRYVATISILNADTNEDEETEVWKDASIKRICDEINDADLPTTIQAMRNPEMHELCAAKDGNPLKGFNVTSVQGLIPLIAYILREMEVKVLEISEKVERIIKVVPMPGDIFKNVYADDKTDVPEGTPTTLVLAIKTNLRFTAHYAQKLYPVLMEVYTHFSELGFNISKPWTADDFDRVFNVTVGGTFRRLAGACDWGRFSIAHLGAIIYYIVILAKEIFSHADTKTILGEMQEDFDFETCDGIIDWFIVYLRNVYIDVIGTSKKPTGGSSGGKSKKGEKEPEEWVKMEVQAFKKYFGQWIKDKTGSEIAQFLFPHGRKIPMQLLTPEQAKEAEETHASLQKAYKRARKAEKTAEKKAAQDPNAPKPPTTTQKLRETQAELGARDDELAKLKEEIQRLRNLAQVPVEAVEVMGKLRATEKKLEDAKNDLEEANEALEGTRTTLEMAEANIKTLENNLKQSEENLHAADAELESTKTELVAASEQIETLRRNAAVLGHLDPAVQVDERVAEPMEVVEKVVDSKKRKADAVRKSGRTKYTRS